MGSYVKGIHNGGEAWLTQLRAQTGYFALVYKHMRSQENGLCRLESLNEQWDDAVGREAERTVDHQVQFLRATMGISDLEWYFRTHRAEYPNHTHVVFWGDDGDGVAGLDGQAQVELQHSARPAPAAGQGQPLARGDIRVVGFGTGTVENDHAR